jgi:hypothetical protein
MEIGKVAGGEFFRILKYVRDLDCGKLEVDVIVK